MFKEIRDDILDVMSNFGIVRTIVVSHDIYDELTENQRYALESYLDVTSPMHWMILFTIENHYHFVCSHEPI